MKQGFSFPAEGVEIILPSNYANHNVVKLRKLDTPKKTADEITINFKIIDPKFVAVEELADEFELRVKFSAEKEKNTPGGVDALTLKYNKLGTETWVKFPTQEKIHYGVNQGGVGVVKTKEGDPQVGWFP